MSQIPASKNRLMIGSLALVAALLAIGLMANFLENSRPRWNGLLHDRSAHYASGLKMAVALETADPIGFFSAVDKCKAWPPLHGLLMVPTQILTGNDWRFAVLPSLAGWILMMVCLPLLAIQIVEPMSTRRWIPWVAGAATFFLAALSPAHRIFAVDIMLESLGAGMTALALVSYTAATATVDRHKASVWWNACALILTLLFFEKYNYWAMALLALICAEAYRRRSPLPSKRTLKKLARSGLAFLIRELQHPLTLLALFLFAVVGAILLRGPTEIFVLGQKVSLYPPGNLLTAAYAAIFFRVVLVVRTTRWTPTDAALRAFWYWQVIPVAVSFLLPRRLFAFARFLSPTNHGDAPTREIPAAAIFYSNAILQNYHTSEIALGIAVIGALAGLLLIPKERTRIIAPLALLLIGLLLTLLHPNQKSRFLHSWLPMLWVLAGVGMAMITQHAKPLLLSRAIGLGLVIALALSGGSGWFSIGHSPEMGNHGEAGSILDLSDIWVSQLPDHGNVAFVSTQPCKPLVEWTVLADSPRQKRLEWMDVFATTAPEIRKTLQTRWAETTAETLVTLEFPPDSEDFISLFDHAALRHILPQELKTQGRFVPIRDTWVRGARVRVWKRADSVPSH